MKLGSVSASQLELFKNTLLSHSVVKKQSNNRITADRIISSFELNDSDLSTVDFRWSIEKYLRLGKATIDAFDLPELGLILGQKTHIGHLGLLGLGCQSAPTLNIACRLLTEFEPLIFENIRGQSKFTVNGYNMRDNNGSEETTAVGQSRTSARVSDKRVVLSFYSIAPYSQNNLFIVDSVLLGWASILKFITGVDDLIESVNLEFRAPSYAAKYQQAFNCEINFEQKGNFLVLKSEYLNVANRFACQQTFNVMKEAIKKATSAHEAANNIVVATKQQITKQLSLGTVSLSSIAKSLQVSPWTLKRQLRAHGTSFQQVFNQTRAAIATAYLKQRNYNVAQISELLGFSSSTAFQHAYKRWTGKAPGNVRKRIDG